MNRQILTTDVNDGLEKIFLFEYCINYKFTINFNETYKEKLQQDNLQCTLTILISKYMLEIFFFKVIQSNSKVIVNYTPF